MILSQTGWRVGSKADTLAALEGSLGAEDQVLTDMIARIDKSTKIFTLDTGRVFPETYQTLHDTNKKYGINVEVYFPNSEKVERMVNEKGINLFYESIENNMVSLNNKFFNNKIIYIK